MKTKQCLFLSIISVLFLLTPLPSFSSEPWPVFHHDTQHTGRSPYIGSQTATFRWAFLTGSVVFSSPAIGADGTVYVGSYDHNVYALDGATGSQKWVFTASTSVNSSPAIGADGTVYVGGGPHIYALDGATGTQKWVFPTGFGNYLSSPSIGADGTVYVGDADGMVYAIGPFLNVDIDIKPGSDTNRFNQNERGVIPVAILGSENLSVTQINVDTLRLEGLAVKMAGKSGKYLAHFEDVNADGYLDLVVQFQDRNGSLASGNNTATLTGQLSNGAPIQGLDSICIVP